MCQDDATVQYEILLGDCECKRQKITYKFEDNKQQVVDNKRPFTAIAVRSDSKGNGTDRSEHQHQGDSPRNVSVCAAKVFCQVRHGQGDGKEVKCVPSLSDVKENQSFCW